MRQGELVIKHEKVDTCQIVADVVDMAQALVAQPVELINLVRYMPMIVADSDRLTQIMFNLVGNAGMCEGPKSISQSKYQTDLCHAICSQVHTRGDHYGFWWSE